MEETYKHFWTFETLDVDGNVDGYCLKAEEIANGMVVDVILKRFRTKSERNHFIGDTLADYSADPVPSSI